MENREYTTNEEYREMFRRITNQAPFSPETAPNPDNIDSESLDEMAYDESAVITFMETMYNNTHSHPLFGILYDSAAAKMISTNRSIGMAVLMAYDYLWAFYPCYCDFCQDPVGFDETNPWYKKILELIS